MNLAFKYRSGSDRDLLALALNQLFIPLPHELNDPFEGTFDFDASTAFIEILLKSLPASDEATLERSRLHMTKRIQQMGVFSLSKNVCNELLWAHYGNQHRGFAIEYNIEIIKNALRIVWLAPEQIDIKYNNKPGEFAAEFAPLVIEADANNDIEKGKEVGTHILQQMIATKSDAWKYEEETRLILKGHGVIHIPHSAVKSIYFGLRSTERDRTNVMDLLRGRGISYYVMVQDGSQYLLKPKAIEDEFLYASQYIPHQISYDPQFLSNANLGRLVADKNDIKEAIESICRIPNVKSIDKVICGDSLFSEALIVEFSLTLPNRDPIRFNFGKYHGKPGYFSTSMRYIDM